MRVVTIYDTILSGIGHDPKNKTSRFKDFTSNIKLLKILRRHSFNLLERKTLGMSTSNPRIWGKLKLSTTLHCFNAPN